MQCVACKEPMVVLEVDNVEIDYCLECGGIWLDAGELEIFTGAAARARQLLEEAQKAGTHESAKRRCPICMKRMEILMIGDDHDVEIDSCRKNHGLWFDRGELETVLAFFSEHKNKNVADLLHRMFSSEASPTP